RNKGRSSQSSSRRAQGTTSGNEETIVDQKDSSVQSDLSMVKSGGPSQAIVEVTHERISREACKGTFQQLKENDLVDEDNSEDFDNDTWGDDDKSDLDYEDPKPVVSDQGVQVVEIALHNLTVEKEVPIEGFSSPPSSPYAEEVYSQAYHQDAVTEFISGAVDVQEADYNVLSRTHLQVALDDMDVFIDRHRLGL
ncbi:hypothetical protein BGZ54_010454, partial [Gamsiella multidivaricata]